ncbi:MAG: DUF4367 domain-containing protein [Clostridia bacterium]|nr:DUF4367 domain-containing protein [Clostridia bacterium]
MFLSKEIDEKLIEAFEIYNQNLCKSLPSDEELRDIMFSEAFEKKMEKLIRAQKKSYYYLINTVGKRVAIIVLAIMISLTATTFSVKAIRESVIEFIAETFEKFTTVSVENDESDTEVEFVKTAPKYVPEDYSVESELETEVLYRIIYNNIDNNAIDYMQTVNLGTIANVNTESIAYERISIYSCEGMKYVKNGINAVVFADETYLYTIQGQVSFDELIKMAESIKTE